MRHREIIMALEKWHAASPHQPMSILDLGCGDALVATTVFGRQRGICYCGVDLSSEAMLLAKERTQELNWHTEWLEADLLDALGQMQRRFDLVLAGYSLHHCSQADAEKALKHVHRVLNEQGSLLVYDALRRADESRDAYLRRFLNSLDATWEAFDSAQRQAIREHVESCDYPIDLAQWLALSGRSSFKRTKLLYRDESEFYGLMSFSKSTDAG